MSAASALTPAEALGVGVCSGTIEVCLQQPTLYLKNATQQRLPFTLNPFVLYRGLTMSVANMGILTGIQFPLSNLVTRALTGGESRKLTPAEQITSGFAGGAMSGVVCAPMELVMIQQQRFGESNLFRVGARIVRDHGVSTLYRGLLTACGREAFFCAGVLGLGPVFTEALQERFGLGEKSGSLLGAVGAGVISATLSHPLDTVKTCMQGDIQQAKYTSVTSTVRTLLRDERLPRLFAGWGWRTVRIIGATFIIGQCKDRLSELLLPRRHRLTTCS